MRFGLALLASTISTLALAASPQSEGFRQLTGAQIRQAFAGKRFTDDVHFSFSYLANGEIRGAGMGKAVTNHWSVEQGSLCIKETADKVCYIVWKKGAAVRLVFEGSDLSLDGYVR